MGRFEFCICLGIAGVILLHLDRKHQERKELAEINAELRKRRVKWRVK